MYRITYVSYLGCQELDTDVVREQSVRAGEILLLAGSEACLPTSRVPAVEGLVSGHGDAAVAAGLQPLPDARPRLAEVARVRRGHEHRGADPQPRQDPGHLPTELLDGQLALGDASLVRDEDKLVAVLHKLL